MSEMRVCQPQHGGEPGRECEESSVSPVDQGTPLQSLMGLSSQTSWGSVGKLARGSLSFIWEVGGGSASCNMSLIAQVGTEWDPGCFGTRHPLPLLEG